MQSPVNIGGSSIFFSKLSFSLFEYPQRKFNSMAGNLY